MYIHLHFITYTLFFLNNTATTEIYTLSLHDALPISTRARAGGAATPKAAAGTLRRFETRSRGAEDELPPSASRISARSEEHTSELQSHVKLVCRLLLEKKNLWNGSHAAMSWLLG